MELSSHGLNTLNTGNKTYHFSFKLFLSSNMVSVTFKNVTQKNLGRQAVVVWMMPPMAPGSLNSWFPGLGGTALLEEACHWGPALRA